MSDPTWDEDYIPYATCSDCGQDTIVPFEIKPDYPACDGFCDSCGCLWFKGVTVITPENLWHKITYQSTLPWGNVPKIVNVPTPKSNITLISSRKVAKPEIPDFKNTINDILPSDYQECNVCGYDHTYDPKSAERKHNSL